MSNGSARILVVDDEESIRKLLERGLTQAHYRCATAQSAEHAAEVLQREEFDLVFLDIRMPGKSGMEFLPEITTQHPDTAVVMLTGVGELSTAVQAMRGGAYDYATKPLDLAELVIRIEHALSRRALVLEKRMYQHKLQAMVDELNALLEQRKREVKALNNLFHSHILQSDGAQNTYTRLQRAMADFGSELEGLATMSKIIDQDDAPAEYRVKQVKIR